MPAMSPVLTRSYNNARSGTTTTETILTADAVRERGIVRLFSLPLPDDLRGTEGQPLIAPGIKCADGFTHDLVLIATMGNMVYAFDANADAPTLIWAQRVGNPIRGSAKIDSWKINSQWGITSTPVIDLEAGVIFVVAYSSPTGDYQDGAFFAHMLDLRDGAPVATPLSLESAIDAHGNKFSGVQRKQRAGLLITNINGRKVLYVGAGSIFESLDSNLGWLIAIDLQSFKIVSALTTCPKQGGGGIWMGSQGPAADKAGNVYFVTGNGHFDGLTELAECTVRAKLAGNKLTVDDWFCAFSDAMRDHNPAPPGTPTTMNGWDDQDRGSAGICLVELFGFGVDSGKDGISFVTRLANLGKTTVADLEAGRQYAALAWPPEWFTYYPGPDKDPAPADPTKLNFNFGGVTHHMHSSPVHYAPVVGRQLIYCWGENGNLRAWRLMPTGELVYRGASVETASWEQPGMPGGMITCSADGADPHSGIIWGCAPSRDANRVISPGRLTAHSATNLIDSPAGPVMETLWNSQDWNIGFLHNKFAVPTVSGGRVFVPTYGATVDVYGLTPA